MNRYRTIPLLACITSTLACAPRQAQPTTKLPSGVQDLAGLLEPLRYREGLPALGAAVVSGDQVIALGVVGTRKDGDDTRAEAVDRFHLGSCSKAFTATLAATLVEDKVIAWETTLDLIFPELASKMNPAYRQVTLAQLLAHRGGVIGDLQDHADLWDPIQTDRRPVTEQRLWITRLALAKPPQNTPGTAWAYSDVGYIIAGAALERVTKKSWETLIRERIFQPLKMSGCGFGAPASPGKVDQPWGHTADYGDPVDPGGPDRDLPAAMGPAATVHCSLGDWARFITAHLQGARGQDGLLPAAAFKRMHTPWPGPGNAYALGWEFEEDPWAGGLYLFHAGSNTMWLARTYIISKLNLAFLMISNRGGMEAKAALGDVKEALVARFARQPAQP